MILALLKLGCLLVYAAGLAGAVGLLPAGIAGVMEAVAVGMLVLHGLEVVFALRHVRRYPGPLGASILLTLLFGVLHWKPLANVETST